jgi:hypothetical protein
MTGGSGVQSAVCGKVSRPEERVTVAAAAGPERAHVIMEGDGLHDRVAFTLWLVSEGGQWRLLEVYLSPVTYTGKTPADFEEMAKAEQREHRLLNAKLLYLEAQVLADRGPRLQLGIMPRIAEGSRSVKLPGPLAGDGPFLWKTDDARFKVLNVAPIGLADGKGNDKLYVVVHHEIDPWVDDDDADRKNRALIEAFRKTYPSYRRHFAGIAMRGQEKEHGPGTHGFGTVHQNDDDPAGEAGAGHDPQ